MLNLRTIVDPNIKPSDSVNQVIEFRRIAINHYLTHCVIILAPLLKDCIWRHDADLNEQAARLSLSLI